MIDLMVWVAPAEAAVTVSRLVIRDADTELFSRLSEADARTRVLNALDAGGVETAGKDDALFGTNAADKAQFVLGGEVQSVVRLGQDPTQVEAAVEWRLFDRTRNEVIYTVTTTGYVARSADVHDLVIAAVDDAVGRLLAREKFREIAESGLEPDLPPMVDIPDGSRLKMVTAKPVAKRAGPGRAIAVAGGVALGGGAVVIGTTALAAGNATWVSDAGWAGLVTGNSAGWLLAVSGAAALTTGLVMELDGAAIAVGPGGIAVGGRF